MGKITALDPLFHLDVPGGNFCQWKRLSEAVLSISEKPRSPHDQIWVKWQLWIHNSFFKCTR